MLSFVEYCTISYNIKQYQSKIMYKTIQFCVQNQTIMNKHVQKSGFFAPGFATMLQNVQYEFVLYTYCLDCSFCNIVAKSSNMV